MFISVSLNIVLKCAIYVCTYICMCLYFHIYIYIHTSFPGDYSIHSENKLTWGRSQHRRAQASTICFRPYRGSLGNPQGKHPMRTQRTTTSEASTVETAGIFGLWNIPTHDGQPVERHGRCHATNASKTRVRPEKKELASHLFNVSCLRKVSVLTLTFLEINGPVVATQIFLEFSPRNPWGDDSQFDLRIFFKGGWFKNHQPVTKVIHMLGTHKSCVLPICNQLFSAALVTWAP